MGDGGAPRGIGCARRGCEVLLDDSTSAGQLVTEQITRKTGLESGGSGGGPRGQQYYWFLVYEQDRIYQNKVLIYTERYWCSNRIFLLV